MLTVENLSFGYHRQALFSDISFSLNAGQLLYIAGDNGAGKSSLLNVIAGLLSPWTGRIDFGPEGRSNCEYLAAESSGHYVHLDAISNLQFWFSLRGIKRANAECVALAEAWQLPRAALSPHVPVSSFSTGMKRKLALLRVIHSQTKLWILDEPTSGLDQKAVALLSTALQDHLKQGGSCILTSHEVTPVRHLISQNLDMNELRK